MNPYSLIEIQSYYNNKLIVSEKVVKKNNLDLVSGEILDVYLNPASLPKSLEVINCGGIPFVFPDKDSAKHDNIACESQNIPISCSCSIIHVLGFCEFDYFKENLNVFYEDNSVESVELSFYCWTKCGKIYDFDIDMNCKVALISGQGGYNLTKYIYYCTCNLKNSNKKIEYLQLPFNPNMHILAITIEK